MQLPVIEQIARKIAARLKTIEPGNGYRIHVTELVRPRRRNVYTPGDGVTVLELDSIEDGTHEIGETSLMRYRTAVWLVTHFIEPSDHDPMPLDLMQSIAIAELERALAEDFELDAEGTYAGPGGFAGIGHNADLRPPQLVTTADGGTAGVRVTLAVGYHHTDRNPYDPNP